MACVVFKDLVSALWYFFSLPCSLGCLQCFCQSSVCLSLTDQPLLINCLSSVVCQEARKPSHILIIRKLKKPRLQEKIFEGFSPRKEHEIDWQSNFFWLPRTVWGFFFLVGTLLKALVALYRLGNECQWDKVTQSRSHGSWVAEKVLKPEGASSPPWPCQVQPCTFFFFFL